MIRGTDHEQDARFPDKTKRMIKNSQWPDKYDLKVDLKKVKYWLARSTTNSSRCGSRGRSPRYWGRKMTSSAAPSSVS